jgi:hypothetical protein
MNTLGVSRSCTGVHFFREIITDSCDSSYLADSRAGCGLLWLPKP